MPSPSSSSSWSQRSPGPSRPSRRLRRGSRSSFSSSFASKTAIVVTTLLKVVVFFSGSLPTQDKKMISPSSSSSSASLPTIIGGGGGGLVVGVVSAVNWIEEMQQLRKEAEEAEERHRRRQYQKELKKKAEQQQKKKQQQDRKKKNGQKNTTTTTTTTTTTKKKRGLLRRHRRFVTRLLRPLRRQLRQIRRFRNIIPLRFEMQYPDEYTTRGLELDRSNWFTRFINDHVHGMSVFATQADDSSSSKASSSSTSRGVVELGKDKFPTPANSRHNWLVLFCNIDSDMFANPHHQQPNTIRKNNNKKKFKAKRTCSNRHAMTTLKKVSRISRNLPTIYDKYYFRQQYRLTKKYADRNATPVSAPLSSALPPPYKVGYVNCKKNQTSSTFCSSIFQEQQQQHYHQLWSVGDDNGSDSNSEKYAVIVDGRIKFLNHLLQQETNKRKGGTGTNTDGRSLHDWVLSYIMKKYIIKIRHKDDIDSKLLAHFYDQTTTTTTTTGSSPNHNQPPATPEFDKPAVLLFLPNNHNNKNDNDNSMNKTTTSERTASTTMTTTTASSLSTWYDELVYHFHDEFVFGIVSNNNQAREQIGQHFFVDRLENGFQVDRHDPELLILFPIPSETMEIVNNTITTTAGKKSTSPSPPGNDDDSDNDDSFVVQARKVGVGYRGHLVVVRATSISLWTTYLPYWLMGLKKFWIEDIMMSDEWQKCMSRTYATTSSGTTSNRESIWVKFSSSTPSLSGLGYGYDTNDRQYHTNHTTTKAAGSDADDDAVEVADDDYYDSDTDNDDSDSEEDKQDNDGNGGRATAGDDQNQNGEANTRDDLVFYYT